MRILNHLSIRKPFRHLGFLFYFILCIIPFEYRLPTYIPPSVNNLSINYPCFNLPMEKWLWQYLRKGLNYLEASGKEYPPYFVHPKGLAYGPLGLTRIAVLDVIQKNPIFSKVNPDDVFKDSHLYELFACSYADILLRIYLKLEYQKMDPQDVFLILHRIWFLGPGLYKAGYKVSLLREKKAEEYLKISSPSTSS